MIELLLLAMLQLNPACVAQDAETFLWGAPGAGIVELGPVPQGRMWLVRAAGGFTTDGAAAEYMMEIVRPVRSQGGACCWRIPVAKNVGAVSSTPSVALGRPIVLHEGERLSVRRGSSLAGQLGINAVYYDMPRSCLALAGSP